MQVCCNKIEILNELKKIKKIASIPMHIVDANDSIIDFTIHIDEHDEFNIKSWSYNEVKIYASMTEGIACINFIKDVLGQIICYLCFKEGILLLHSSAIRIRNQTFLFVGKSFGGKTTLAYLLSKIFNSFWLADDWLGIKLIGDKFVIEKTDSDISMRSRTFNLIRDYSVISSTIFDGYNLKKEKYIFKYDELGISAKRTAFGIDFIFLIDICENKEKNIYESKDVSVADKLCKEISWVLKGEGSKAYDINGNIVYDGFNLISGDDLNYIKYIARKMMEKTRVYILEGDIKSAVDYIRTLVGNEENL